MMDATALIVALASILTAITVVVTTYRKFGLWLAKKIAQNGVNFVRKRDVDPKSFVGQGFIFNEEIIKQQKELSSAILQLDESVKRNRANILRIELLQLIHNSPDSVEIIEHVFEDYRKSGGNSYMVNVIKEWRKVYGEETIKKKLSSRR